MTVQPDPMFARTTTRGRLPYGETAGHVDVDTSRTRAEREAVDGTAERRRLGIIQLLGNSGTVGMTWKEISTATGEHHGQVSGALSGLHKDGTISALKFGRRNGCGVYVLPQHVASRPVRDFKPNQAAPPARPCLTDDERALIRQIKAVLPNYNDRPTIVVKPKSMAILVAALERLDRP